MEFRLSQYQGHGTLKFKIESHIDTLKLTYFVPDHADLIWPSYSGMVRRDELWLSTCFELFLGADKQSGYTELNVTPAGGWNCYQFDDYRNGMKPSQAWELQQLKTAAGFLSATFTGRLSASRIRLGPAVILQRLSSKLDYFAISHDEQPDFHDPARHVLVSANDL